MFSTIVTSLLLVSSMAAGGLSKPVPKNRLDFSRRTPDFSFNNWHGISSLNGFDDFYGHGNFDGSFGRTQTIVKDKKLVCHKQEVVKIQQRLVVLQEMAKRIITETICEVETQTLVFEQHWRGLQNYGHDLRRVSHFKPGYDFQIASHATKFFNHDGSLNFDDWGFSGHDLGKNVIVADGHNWNDLYSPVTVGNAYQAASDAYISLHPDIKSTDISPDIVSSEAVPSDIAPSDVAPSDAGVPPVPAPSDAAAVTPVSDPALAPASTDAVAASPSPSGAAAPSASA